MKGLVPAAILKPYYQDDNDNNDLVEGEEYDVSNDERQKPPVDEQIDGDGIGLVKQDSFASVSHSYVNEANKKEEVNIMIYSFNIVKILKLNYFSKTNRLSYFYFVVVPVKISKIT